MLITFSYYNKYIINIHNNYNSLYLIKIFIKIILHIQDKLFLYAYYTTYRHFLNYTFLLRNHNQLNNFKFTEVLSNEDFRVNQLPFLHVFCTKVHNANLFQNPQK